MSRLSLPRLSSERHNTTPTIHPLLFLPYFPLCASQWSWLKNWTILMFEPRSNVFNCSMSVFPLPGIYWDRHNKTPTIHPLLFVPHFLSAQACSRLKTGLYLYLNEGYLLLILTHYYKTSCTYIKIAILTFVADYTVPVWSYARMYCLMGNLEPSPLLIRGGSVIIRV